MKITIRGVCLVLVIVLSFVVVVDGQRIEILEARIDQNTNCVIDIGGVE